MKSLQVTIEKFVKIKSWTVYVSYYVRADRVCRSKALAAARQGTRCWDGSCEPDSHNHDEESRIVKFKTAQMLSRGGVIEQRGMQNAEAAFCQNPVSSNFRKCNVAGGIDNCGNLDSREGRQASLWHPGEFICTLTVAAGKFDERADLEGFRQALTKEQARSATS